MPERKSAVKRAPRSRPRGVGIAPSTADVQAQKLQISREYLGVAGDGTVTAGQDSFTLERSPRSLGARRRQGKRRKGD
jgi:hypothetical protein